MVTKVNCQLFVTTEEKLELDGHMCLCYKIIACWFSKRRERALYSFSERDQAGKPLSIVNMEHLVFQPLFRMFLKKYGGQNKS